MLIGDFRVYIGLLKYKEEYNWYNSPIVLAAIGAPASFLLVIGLVLLGVCLCRKRNEGEEPQPKEADVPSRPKAVGLGSRTELLPVVRRASVDNIQNDGYLHQVPDGVAGEYLQPVQEQMAKGGVPQKPNYTAVA